MNSDEDPAAALAAHCAEWTWAEDKAFETALGNIPEDAPDRWERIVQAVPLKTIEEVKFHYELLVDDVGAIEAGRVALPNYVNNSEDGGDQVGESGSGTSKRGGHRVEASHGGTRASRSDERRKGLAWSEEEHRQFLLGLEKYGKGDWRSISRNYVVSRTPTQVASHAQKYFIRMNSVNKDRRRSSIHDITSVGNGEAAISQGPITGQTSTSVAGTSSGRSSKQQPGGPGHNLYSATTLGQPVGGPAVGTPVNFPAPGHMAYGVRAPVPMLPGAPSSMAPTAYSMPHAAAHR